MSGMRHATISAWQRHEDGSYAAELHGWSLHVVWHPEGGHIGGDPRTPAGPRGFSWHAEQGDKKLASEEIHEEIEIAMAEAEAHTAPALEPALAADGGGDGHGHH